MSDTFIKLQILARAEMALARIRIQLATRQSVMLAAAALSGLLGLGLFNLAAFFAISPSQGPAVAALVVGLINAAITIGFVLIARTMGPNENEQRLALEMRDLATTELNRDVAQVKEELAQLSADVRSIHGAFKSFSDVTTKTLVPLLGMVFKFGKKDKD